MKTRAISALVAVLILFLVGRYGESIGLFILCAVVAFRCAFEYAKLTFGLVQGPKHIRFIFLFLTSCIFVATVWAESYALAVLGVSAMVFLTTCVLLIKEPGDMARALNLQAIGLMGFLYSGVFTAITTKTLQLPGGMVWFYSLLIIVFAGDTGAYLVGKSIGKRPLLSAVSPRKTLEGSIGGLLGSVIAGIVIQSFFLKDVPLGLFISTSLVTGIFAQMGDLFESLIKRVAEVKDSGSIMPGHGGALDRLDGVLFASPIFYSLFRFFLS